jgi:hypothetical protein
MEAVRKFAGSPQICVERVSPGGGKTAVSSFLNCENYGNYGRKFGS